MEDHQPTIISTSSFTSAHPPDSPGLHPRTSSNSSVNGNGNGNVKANGGTLLPSPTFRPQANFPLSSPGNKSVTTTTTTTMYHQSDAANPYGREKFPMEKNDDGDNGDPFRADDTEEIDLGETVKKIKQKPKVSAAVIVPIWIALSSGVIVYNKYLYSTANFPYPIFITSFHLGCAALGTRVLRRTTGLMDGLDGLEMGWDRYIRNIIPIGILFSGSLILSNTAYLTLSVSFIQMLKAFTPVSILLISAIFRIQALNARLVGIVVLISTGCCLAAIGELHFERFGFICQSLAVVFESSRLVMIQLLLQGLKMDPLCSLHYYAPVCAIINACFLPFTEGMAPFLALPRIGFFIMSTNALNAFLLNVAAVFLIGAAGGLVLTLAGVFKDILLITASVVFFGSVITPVQVLGYGIALIGLVAFKTAGK